MSMQSLRREAQTALLHRKILLRCCQKGFVMLELVMVLIIGVVIAMSAAQWYSSIMLHRTFVARKLQLIAATHNALADVMIMHEKQLISRRVDNNIEITFDSIPDTKLERGRWIAVHGFDTQNDYNYTSYGFIMV